MVCLHVYKMLCLKGKWTHLSTENNFLNRVLERVGNMATRGPESSTEKKKKVCWYAIKRIYLIVYCICCGGKAAKRACL